MRTETLARWAGVFLAGLILGGAAIGIWSWSLEGRLAEERVKLASLRERTEQEEKAEALTKQIAAAKQAQAAAKAKEAHSTARASSDRTKPGRTLPTDRWPVPPERTSTITIAATGEIEPLQVGLSREALTQLRFQYPLKVDEVTGTMLILAENGSQTVWINPPVNETMSYVWEPAGEATIRLKDGRSLVVTGSWVPLTFDQVVNIQLPPACIGPAAQVGCEAERKQVAQLTEANAGLAHAVRELAQHPALSQSLAEHNGRDAEIMEGLAGGTVGDPPAFKVPEQPFTWQKPPPCDAAAAQEAVNGGCWIQTNKTAPCPSKSFEHDGKCFVPVGKKPPAPARSEEPERRDSQPDP